MTSIAFRNDGLWLLFADGEEVGPFTSLAGAETWLGHLETLTATR